MIYFNNAATTWPKPEVVYQTVDKCFRDMDSPNRSAAEGVLHADPMAAARKVIAPFFGINDPTRLILTPGCTYALNLAILGIDWQAGDVAIMSGLEHHAVSRPIRKLAVERKIRFLTAPYTPDCPIDLDFVEDKLKGGTVKLVACTMASNVTGDIFPVNEVVELAHRYNALCLVDLAQASGILEVDAETLGADMFAFAGHKGLFGPPGIGGLYVAPGLDLRTLAEGGTGGDSGEHGLAHKVPNAYEVGTHNLPAVAGLAAGVKWIQETGLPRIRAHERKLAGQFLEGISDMTGVTVFGTRDLKRRTGVVSLTMDGTTPKDLAKWLVEKHKVTTRAGFHCAPLSHETIGTCPGEGTIRFSFGFFNTPDEVSAVLQHLAEAPRAVAV